MLRQNSRQKTQTGSTTPKSRGKDHGKFHPVIRWFTPQPKQFRDALSFTGHSKRKTVSTSTEVMLRAVFWIERVVLLAAFIYCIVQNNLRLWLLIVAIGAAVVVRKEFLFVWWYLKVHLWKRNYYKERRQLYSQGTLQFHFFSVGGKRIKKPFHFKITNVTIWASSNKIAASKHKTINQPGEYIKN